MYLDRNIENMFTVSMQCRPNKIVMSIPSAIRIDIVDRSIFVSGELGKLYHILHKSIDAEWNDTQHLLLIHTNNVVVNDKFGKTMIGTTRSLIRGMINGVTVGFTKSLQLIGIGYRVVVKNNIINLTIGLSHSINYILPKMITVTCVNQTEIIITGISKQLVGQVAADLRALRPPEPFKGKGIRYMDEIVHIRDAKKR